MGFDLILIPKTRDDEVGLRIYRCSQTLAYKDWSRNFSTFLSSAFEEGSEFNQVERILDINLSLLRSYPVNWEPQTGELEYELSLAEENDDDEKAKSIRQQIEQVEREWEENYDRVNEGWMNTSELKTLITTLEQKIHVYPDYHKLIQFPSGWVYPWGDYFTLKPRKSSNDERLIDDLKALYGQVECAEKYGQTLVALIGG